MSPPQPDDEPITARVTKAVETRMEREDRRASDRAWEFIKPIAIYLICGTIVAALLLWKEQAIQSTEVLELKMRIAKLEERDVKIDDLTARAKENDARHDELAYWRRAMEQRVGDLAAAIIEREKQKNIKGQQ